MSSKIFKLKQQASTQNREWAKRVSEHLTAKGFDGIELDDLVYAVAEAISVHLRSEMGAAMGQKLAHQEYTAVEEINQHSMEDQLLVIRGWHTNDEDLRQILTASLGIALPEGCWTVAV